MDLPATPRDEPSAAELRFIFRSGRLCLDFCATVGERWQRCFERLRTPDDLTRWYAEAGLVVVPVPAGNAALEAARTAREAVYRVARATITGRPPAPGDVHAINQAAAAPPPVPRMTSGPTVTLTPAGPDPAASALSAVARDAISLFAAEDARRLRACASPECGLLFLDRSRPGKRRWCSSSACGGKTRAAAYRQRQVRVPTLETGINHGIRDT